jgi:hypothetical protein
MTERVSSVDSEATPDSVNSELLSALQHALSDEKASSSGGAGQPSELLLLEKSPAISEPSPSLEVPRVQPQQPPEPLLLEKSPAISEPPPSPETPRVRPQQPTATHAAARRAREESCIMIGPSGAGKTCILAALDPACYASPVDDSRQLGLRYDFTFERQSPLSRYAVDWVADGQPPPATENCYDFMLKFTQSVRKLFRSPQLAVTTIHCTDSPGGVLFPTRADLDVSRVDVQTRERLLAQAALATSIVLVIDSTAPACDLIELHLRSILDRIVSSPSREELPQPLRIRILDGIWPQRRSRADRRIFLPTSRFLILLTKIDRLALKLSQQLKKQGVDASPLAVANAIDPVALACELIGERNLRRIWAVMRRQARLAVGISSVTGFVRDEEGQTFLDWCDGRDAEERLDAWTSFGVYEALRFITTGQCGGPVQQVHAEADLILEQALRLDSFPFTR